jgi:hypothetical protein
MIRAALLAAVLAGPALAQEDLPEGYPPVMGDVTATVDGQPMAWQTYDFSIGAFDASAWITDDDTTGVVTLRMMAFAPGDPDRLQDRLRIQAEYPALPVPGVAPSSVLVEVLGEDGIDGRKMTSEGRPATLALEGFSRDSYAYGRIEATFDAEICLKVSDRSPVTRPCKRLTGSLDSALQFDNMGDF